MLSQLGVKRHCLWIISLPYGRLQVGCVRISVVIVNFNGAGLLPECLDAVTGQTLKPAETIVVDNGSSDASVALLRQRYPEVRLHELEDNRFFAAGSNLGILASSGEFVLLLNNDCILDPQFLEKAVKPMLEDERIGAVAGKIRRVGGELLDQAGQTVSRSRKPLDRGYGQHDGGQFDEADDVLSAGGVAPLIRREMLDDIAMDGQFFDEDFVQYYEDLDFFWRAANLGWRCRYTPEATARHYRGASGQSDPSVHSWVQQFAFANLPRVLQTHLLKNRYAVMAKNDRFGRWLLNFPWIFFYELKVLVYMLLIKPRLLPDYFRGFGFLRTAFRKRRIIKAMMRDRGLRRFIKV